LTPAIAKGLRDATISAHRRVQANRHPYGLPWPITERAEQMAARMAADTWTGTARLTVDHGTCAVVYGHNVAEAVVLSGRAIPCEISWIGTNNG
jgi:hypothetical protein